MNEIVPVPEKLLRSKKYSKICPDTIRRVWVDCIGKYRKLKDAEHAAREALHGISGAFMQPGDSLKCIEEMRLWKESNDRLHLETALSLHASTRERLPLSRIDEIFTGLLLNCPESPAVLDLACGIDPLYLAARGIRVTGCDISGESVDLINNAAQQLSLPCKAYCSDLLCSNSLPNGDFDLALLFKVLPLLDRQCKGGADRVLEEITADRIAVSFPTRTLGGKNVGMESHYSEWMETHIPAGRYIENSFVIGNELFYILKKEEAEQHA